MTAETGHATISQDGSDFTSLADLYPTEFFNRQALAALAAGMANAHDELSDGPDVEENRHMPAGYTYLGQFIDHDLTLDTASSLTQGQRTTPNNLRTPRLDLDCVYGRGPDDQPYLYMQADGLFNPAADPGAPLAEGYLLYQGASLLPGGAFDAGYHFVPHGTATAHDLLRAPNGRAIIGDKRNDENSIVNQVQQLFIAFHNRVVELLFERHPELRDDRGRLFAEARKQVRWAYQSIVIRDFLKRIVQAGVVDQFHHDYLAQHNGVFKLYKRPEEHAVRDRLPREFSVAAYRFGHSAVRLGYRLNRQTALSIFANVKLNEVTGPIPPLAGERSLVGFEPLAPSHVIDDWNRFFPADDPLPGSPLTANVGEAVPVPDPDSGTPPTPEQVDVRLQFAYKLDPSLVEPLINLPAAISGRGDLPPEQRPPNQFLGPSLALLNLLRGNRYRIATAQKLIDVARHQGFNVPVLDAKYLCVRVVTDDGANGKRYTFVPINHLPVPPALAGSQPPAATPPHTLGELQDLQAATPLWFYVLAEAQQPIVDYWLSRGGRVDDRTTDLTEADLKGVAADTGLPLANISASGTQLTGLGARILLEVFYAILHDDPDSVLASPPPDGRLIWDEPGSAGTAAQASMAHLIRFTAQPGKTFGKVPLVWK